MSAIKKAIEVLTKKQREISDEYDWISEQIEKLNNYKYEIQVSSKESSGHYKHDVWLGGFRASGWDRVLLSLSKDDIQHIVENREDYYLDNIKDYLDSKSYNLLQALLEFED